MLSGITEVSITLRLQIIWIRILVREQDSELSVWVSDHIWIRRVQDDEKRLQRRQLLDVEYCCGVFTHQPELCVSAMSENTLVVTLL